MESFPLNETELSTAAGLCLELAQESRDEVFLVDEGRRWNGLPNTSMLYNTFAELSYKESCAASCESCKTLATYANRVLGDNSRYLTVPGTGQDVVFFFFLALLVGCLTRARWRWADGRWGKAIFTVLHCVDHTILVFLAGAVAQVFVHEFNLRQISNSFHWLININPPELTFYLFLPVLLFDASMRIRWFYFKSLATLIVVFALLVVILNVLLTGVSLQYLVIPLVRAFGIGLQDWNLYHGFLFGSIIASTDPVSVMSAMESNMAPLSFLTLIGGESLLNDGSGYILFEMFLQAGMTYFPNPSVLEIFLDILYSFGLGCVCGSVCGLLLVLIIKSLNEQRASLETCFSLCGAYASFYVSQSLLNASGPVSVSVTGLWMAAAGMSSVSGPVRQDLLSFFQILAFIAESVVFFLSGVMCVSLMQAEASDIQRRSTATLRPTSFLWGSLVPLPIIIVLQVLFRGVWITLLYPFMSRLGLKPLDWRKAVFLNFSALRGGVNIIMSLIVATVPPSELNTDLKFFITIWSVGFTLFSILTSSAVGRLLAWSGLIGVSTFQEAMLQKAKESIRKFVLQLFENFEHDPHLRFADLGRLFDFLMVGFDEREGKEGNAKETMNRVTEDGHDTFFFNAPEDKVAILMRRSFEFHAADEPTTTTSLVFNFKSFGIHSLGQQQRSQFVAVKSSKALQAARQEDSMGAVRIRLLDAMVRGIRRERVMGRVSPYELQVLEQAFDESSHNSSTPLSLSSLTSGPEGSFSQRKRLFGVCVSLHKILSDAMERGKAWIQKHHQFHQELKRELDLIDSKIRSYQILHPGVVEEVTTSRGVRWAKQEISCFISELRDCGSISDQQAESLEAPLRRHYSEHRSWSVKDILEGILFFQVLDRAAKARLVPLFKERRLGKGDKVDLDGSVAVITRGVAARVTGMSRTLVGRGHVLNLCPLTTKEAYAHSNSLRLISIDRELLVEEMLQAQEGEGGRNLRPLDQFHRAAAASVLESTLRLTSAGGQEEDDDDSGDGGEEFDVEMERLDALRGTLVKRLEVSLDAGSSQVEDMRATLQKSKRTKDETFLRLLSDLGRTSVVELADGDSIVQQSPIVLVSGTLTDKKEPSYTDAEFIEHAGRRKLYAVNSAILVVFCPA
ncbi:sodium/hydrogen exchanger [Chloropicon primus]|uniref:Sodium/hydrogen exchanger n=2 Tax=Chloropicon primus TaxID=1764295 RepID=A0A5B8MQN1_9CHLO|nr:sodium/hydrogen exchanger [Chloropicon primus]UPR00911.1 sodium/hydrogen exchanger [Chloropicon primus]|eukprot:QDZ21690.1 sodium/hydrogen exchanger [Chloropicon primus]